MTDIEQKALALVREVLAERNLSDKRAVRREVSPYTEALCRAIEQHEAFRQEVSGAVEKQAQTVWDIHCRCGTRHPISFNTLEQFIIKPKPDPLVEALHEVDTGPEWDSAEDYCNKVRAALDKLGFEIREKGQ